MILNLMKPFGLKEILTLEMNDSFTDFLSKAQIKGTLLSAYGLYSDSATTRIVEKSANHITTMKLIKRAEYLKTLSREHHLGLLLCWKIKTGFSNGISIERMKLYLDWFFKNHLQQTF